MAQILKDSNEFKSIVLESSMPAMVDFFATWCGPCKMLSPVIDEIAQELSGKAVVVKVDSDQMGETCADYSIKLLPTLVFFKDGKEVDRIVGVASKEDIVEKLQGLM